MRRTHIAIAAVLGLLSAVSFARFASSPLSSLRQRRPCMSGNSVP